jgi:hypothetical protein
MARLLGLRLCSSVIAARLRSPHRTANGASYGRPNGTPAATVCIGFGAHHSEPLARASDTRGSRKRPVTLPTPWSQSSEANYLVFPAGSLLIKCELARTF